MTQELPEGLEELNDTEEAQSEEEESQEEQFDAAAEIQALQEQVAKFQNTAQLAEDLRRSAGRIQSLEKRLQQESADKEALSEQITEQFSGVNELLTGVVENIDETALDPTTKARVREAYAASQRAKETASLRKEVREEVLDSLKEQFPQLANDTASPTGEVALTDRAVAIEQRAVDIFGATGNDPDAPEHAELWNEAANMLKASASDDDVVKMFQEKLRPSNEDSPEDRRQRTKELAGAGTPNPAGTSSEPELKYVEDDPEGNEKQLRELGIDF